jgi:hypothetical protein
MTPQQLDRLSRRLVTRWPLVGGWLRRWAVRSLADDGSPEALEILARAVVDHFDPTIRRLAGDALRRPDRAGQVEVVARVWEQTRHADLLALLREHQALPAESPRLRLLVGLKLQRRADLRNLDADAAPALLTALDESDETIAGEALALLEELTGSETRAVLAVPVCERWARTRAGRLGEVMRRWRLVAAQPIDLRVLSALQSTGGEILLDDGPEIVEPLASACDDADHRIAQAARQTLRTLKKTPTRQAVCRLFLEQDNPHAREAALATGWLPDDPARRALFLFLSEQWDRYDSFDFDRRLLAAVHESADEPLRRRIVERLRSSGRPDFLTVLAGRDFRVRLGRMQGDEAEVLVRILTEYQDWGRLWNLVFELPLRLSVGVMCRLTRVDWQPGREDERAAFARLRELLADGLESAVQRHQRLPPAVQRALARVAGRVNDVAFSPTRPVIAVGTGNRQVVLWNYATGQAEQPLRGFDHAIGLVGFSPDGTLLVAERGRGWVFKVHAWPGGKHIAHKRRGVVTAIEPVAGSQALLAFKDGKHDGRVALFEGAQAKIIQEASFRYYCRGMRVSPNHTRAALLHRGVSVVSVPDFAVVGETRQEGFSQVVTCAAFEGDGDTLVVGRHDGLVTSCRHEGDRLRPEAGLGQHARPVRGLELLHNQSVLLSASTDGLLRFTNRTSGVVLGEVQTPGQRLTSLHLTPGGEFMAVGDSDRSMSLWDLRVLQLPDLFAQPLARSLPVHLVAVNALADAADLPEGLSVVLRYVRVVLEHRFRFDIEIDELPPTMRAGEFDIEIEG